MRKRHSAEDVARLIKEFDRELARGLTVADVCRKAGIAETTYYRWRQRDAPEKDRAERRCRELEAEVERLKRIVADLMVDRQILQDVAKKKW